MNDVIYNKITTVEHCVARIEEVYASNQENLANLTKQESIILNLQRACEASRDLALLFVDNYSPGQPKACLEAFTLLEDKESIEPRLAKSLKSIVAFLNNATTDEQVNRDELETILEHRLEDFTVFKKQILNIKQ